MTTIKSQAEVLAETFASLEELDQIALVLEEKLANHKNLVAGLVGNIEWLKANGNMNTSTIEIVEEKQVAELIEHEGLMLKKVERKAEVGDYVKFFGTNKSFTKNNKFYKVLGGGTYFVDAPFGYSIYGWGPSVTVEVYEVFSELPFLPQSEEVALTDTQKRVQAIQKAKKFVEETESLHSGDCDFKYIVNREKRTVVALLIAPETKSVILRGIAKCHPRDTFNAHIGKAIALNRLASTTAGLPTTAFLSDIEGAPNPDSWAVGQLVKGIDYCSHVPEKETIEVEDNKAWDESGEWWGIDSIKRGSCMISDDTNAKYEVSK